MERTILTCASAALTCAIVATPALWASAAPAQTVAISIGIRETGALVPIGANGGTSGGMEWINLDGQSLALDGTWQTFTFNFQQDAATAFAGGTANGMYDGTRGVLEHIRFRNVAGIGFETPIQVFIDDVVNTTGGTRNLVTGFETTDPIPATVGTMHAFRPPRFAGTTSPFLAPEPNIARVTNAISLSGSQSYELIWAYATTNTSAWMRLTSFQALNQPNPAIDFSHGSTLTFALKGSVVPEPAAGAAVLGLGWLGLSLKRRRHAVRLK